MSVIVIKVKNEGNIATFKKIISAFKEKVNVFTDEEYFDQIASRLIDEGLKTGTSSKENMKKELKKRGVNY